MSEPRIESFLSKIRDLGGVSSFMADTLGDVVRNLVREGLRVGVGNDDERMQSGTPSDGEGFLGAQKDRPRLQAATPAHLLHSR